MDTYIFNLSEEIKYSSKGEFSTTASIECFPPTRRQFKLASKLSQLVMRATMDARKFAVEDEEAVEQEITAEGVKILLLSSESVDFAEVGEVFEKLAVQLCTFDGTVKMTDTSFDSLSLSDFNDLVCGYIANFTFPSLFSGEGL